MAFDATLPATGVTQWADLYAALRNNFNGIYDKLTAEAWKTDIVASGNWMTSDTFKYRKDPFGFVRLTGSFQAGIGPTSSPLSAALPVGYRPANDLHVSYLWDSYNFLISGWLVILASGVVSVENQGLYDFIVFDNISFKAA